MAVGDIGPVTSSGSLVECHLVKFSITPSKFVRFLLYGYPEVPESFQGYQCKRFTS